MYAQEDFDIDEDNEEYVEEERDAEEQDDSDEGTSCLKCLRIRIPVITSIITIVNVWIVHWIVRGITILLNYFRWII